MTYSGQAVAGPDRTCSVAGFIGSPSMNFLPGDIDGDTLKPPLTTFRIPDSVRSRFESGPGGGSGGVVVGLRPEDFEDAAIVGDRNQGMTFKAKIDVLESMGSEFYAYFVVESEPVASRELDELASDVSATQHIHLFDPESGKTLLASNGTGAAAA